MSELKVVEAVLGSKSPDGRHAQVRVLIGEGSSRCSVTRHPVLENGIWVGLNPDGSASERNAQAESFLKAAQADMARANAELEEVNKDRKATAEQVRAAKSKVAAAEKRCKAAKANAEKVAEDFPLQVQFTF